MAQLYRLLGRNIAYFRRQANLTQEELAEKTDYSVDFISLVERGVNAPTLARLNDIADAVGVEIWQLLHPTVERHGKSKKTQKKNKKRSAEPSVERRDQ